MSIKLVSVNYDVLSLRSSRPAPTLRLIKGEKEDIKLWPGDAQPIPLPKVIETNFLCHRCGVSDEFYVLSESMIHCYHCNLNSIQRHDVSKT